MRKPLVTLLCPCYNAHCFIDRFLESILAQTYNNIQIIMINDGSTDDTLERLHNYDEKMKKFASYIVLSKENGGAGSAINTAIPYIKGKYLTWADCDDILYPENIMKKVEFLESNQEYGLVNCQAETFIDGKEGISRLLLIPQDQQRDNIFEQLIHPGVPCYPGVFMIRTQLLISKLDNFSIPYHREMGQNLQLLLPVAYDHKCGYINEPLYGYCVRPDSHSHDIDLVREYERITIRRDILKRILLFLSDSEYEKWTCFINLEYARKKLNIAFAIQDLQKFTEQIDFLKNHGEYLGIWTYIKLLLLKYPLLYAMYKKLKNYAMKTR